MANVLSFVDTYGNWNALFAFVCVTFAIIGALRNRRTHKVKVEKSKVFLPAAIIAITIVGLGIIFVFINSFADLGISINNYNRYGGDDYSYDLIGAIIAVVMLFTFIGVSMLPALIQNRYDARHNRSSAHY
jgi:amino acid transporter